MHAYWAALNSGFDNKAKYLFIHFFRRGVFGIVICIPNYFSLEVRYEPSSPPNGPFRLINDFLIPDQQ